MKVAFVCLVLVACASAGHILPATLLPRVQVAAPQVEIVKQPVTIQQTELVYRQVPVPLRTVQYTAPAVIPSAPIIALHHPHPLIL